MILFLDTDVLIDLALDRKPFSKYADELLDFIQRRHVKTFISWHTVANFYYITRSSMDDGPVKSFIKDLLNFVKIAKTGNDEILLAMKLQMRDFEDAMQVVAALSARSDYILTRNVKDFKNSSVMAMSPKDFLGKGLGV